MTLDVQLGEDVSIHCEMYSLLLHYKTYKTRQHIFIDHYFKDNALYGASYVIL